MPSLSTLYNLSTVSPALSQLLANYEDQVNQQVIPGKLLTSCRKSGWENTIETSTVKPELKRPNEGFIGASCVKNACMR